MAEISAGLDGRPGSSSRNLPHTPTRSGSPFAFDNTWNFRQFKVGTHYLNAQRNLGCSPLKNGTMITSLLPQPLVRGAASLAVSVLTLALASFSPTQAVAATATSKFAEYVSDQYTELGTFNGVKVFREDLDFIYGGDLTEPGTDFNFLFCHPNRTFNTYAYEVCTGCTIGGKTGDFTAQYVIQGTYDGFAPYGVVEPGYDYPDGSPIFTDYSGYIVFKGTRGRGLAGLRGSGTFDISGTYNYTYFFRP